jgi:DNA recombination protein RmuC
MQTSSVVIIFLGILFLLLNGFAFWVVLRKIEKRDGDEDETGFSLLLQQINELSKRQNELNDSVSVKITENSRHMTDSVRSQFTESQKLIREITEELTHVKETGRRVEGFAEQLQSLQDILKNPKQRGVLGEYYLETLLKNVLAPGAFKMQYKFSDGEIVDAAVFVRDKIIPIDSKFSLENYNRLAEEKNETEKGRLEKLFVNDLKNRIQETSKYIRPNEGTLDFAFMFIPHEAIYYDLLVNKVGGLVDESGGNLIQRAASKYHVIIVSPTSFLAYLQTVLQGLNALQIEEKIHDVIKRVGELGKHLKTYEEYHGKLGNTLSTVVNHYNSSTKEFKKIDKDVLRITGEAVEVDLALIDQPERE